MVLILAFEVVAKKAQSIKIMLMKCIVARQSRRIRGRIAHTPHAGSWVFLRLSSRSPAPKNHVDL
jgi:hypothetical protein